MNVADEGWIQVRYLHVDQVCYFCRTPIRRGYGTPVTRLTLAGKPRTTARKGERGARCYWLRNAVERDLDGRVLLGPNLYECLGCHDERTTAELARRSLPG